MGFCQGRVNYEKLANMFNIPADEMKNYISQCRTGGYARIWKFEDNNGKSGTVQISVSKKHNDGDFVVGKIVNGYDITFQSFANVTGSAYQTLKHISGIPANGLPVQIVSCDVTNKYDKEKGKLYTNYTIFAIELQDKDGNKEVVQKPKKKVEQPDDDELPF